MRAICLAIAVMSGPALADLRIVAADCPVGALDCFQLDDLAAAMARPVVMGTSLVLMGLAPGPTGSRDRLVAVDVDLSRKAVSGVTVLDATPTERAGMIEVAPDGSAYAIFTTDERDHLNRNRRVGAIQVFDAMGQRLGRVSSPYLPGWPDVVDWSPVDLMALYAGTGALVVRDGTMGLRFGDWLMTAGLGDGQLLLAGPADQDLAALLNLIFDPLGYEGLALRPGLVGHYTFPADSRPAGLYLSRPPASDPPDVLAHLQGTPTLIGPPLEALSPAYSAIALSPDGTRLAAIRLSDTRCGPDPVAFELVVHDTDTGRLVWSQSGQRPASLQQDVSFTRGNLLILTEAMGALDPPCGPDTGSAPAVRILLFDPGP